MLTHNGQYEQVEHRAARAQIIGCLVEGNSIRATVRMTGAAKNTVTKLLVDLGAACAEYQDRDAARPAVQHDRVRRDLGVLLRQAEERPERAQAARPATATCGPGPRSAPTRSSCRRGWSGSAPTEDADAFMHDLRGRLAEPRVQLTTDGLGAYREAVGDAFGGRHRLRAAAQGLRPDPNAEARSAATARPSCTEHRDHASCHGDPDPGEI